MMWTVIALTCVNAKTKTYVILVIVTPRQPLPPHLSDEPVDEWLWFGRG
ncbi:hypothetical protein [Streptomyces puniciscabiei]